MIKVARLEHGDDVYSTLRCGCWYQSSALPKQLRMQHSEREDLFCILENTRVHLPAARAQSLKPGRVESLLLTLGLLLGSSQGRESKALCSHVSVASLSEPQRRFSQQEGGALREKRFELSAA